MYFVVALVTISLVLIAHFIRRKYTYWQREGISEVPAKFPFGILDAVVKRQLGFGLVLNDVYNKFESKLVGIYMAHKPTLLVRDPLLARQVMTSEFSSFHDRGIYVDEKNDPLSGNLFSLQGAAWSTLRKKLTPVFTSGKIKGMFGTVDDIGDKLVKHLHGVIEKAPNNEIEMKEVLTTYAIDIIGSVIFGLEIDSFSNPKNEFRELSDQLLADAGLLQKLFNMSLFLFPTLAKIMTRLGLKNKVLHNIRDLMARTVEFREKHNVVRKDLLQLLIRLRNTGKIGEDDDDNWNIEVAQEELRFMSIDKIAAQAFLFYGAGSETTAATSAFTLYELAMYPELLKEVREELDRVMERHNIKRGDHFTYDAVQDLKFLDQCIMETVRKYPGLPFLNRECTRDIKLSDTDYTIKKGTPILISLFGLHRDPNYFPNPMDYDPHRYDPDVMNYDESAYMPFGEGPRHCIALRMGKVNSKLAISKVLMNFDIAPLPRKEVEFCYNEAPILIPVGGLKMHLTKRV